MTKGDGSIMEVKKKDGSSYNPKHWKIRIDLGFELVTVGDKVEKKRRKPWSKTIAGTKTEARKVRDAKRRELEQGIKPDADKVTFREMAESYCKARREAKTAKEKTLKEDESRLRVICELIGDIPLKDIDALTIESLLPAIRQHRINHGRKCSNTSLHKYYKAIKAVFNRAVKYDYLLKNPCDKVENVPQDNPVERRSLTADEAERLLRCIDESEAKAYKETSEKEQRQIEWGVDTLERDYLKGMIHISNVLAIRIGLATGMRLGEVLNLVWSDITGNVITVHRANTKTDAGARKIAIDRVTLKHLIDWKAYQGELLSSIGITQTDQHPVVCTGSGTKTNPNNFRQWWNIWKTENGFPDLLYHELRHTQATLLLANRVDIKTVQTRLGHSDPSMTLGTYGHAIPDNDQAAADLIGTIIGGKKEARIIRLKTA